MTDEQTDPDKVTPEQEARDRARECGAEIETVLRKHRCQIAPYLRPLEPIGTTGSRAMVQADYGIVPQP